MLRSLELNYLGPAPRLAVEFAPRLNIFTGDNGLGKSFLLDICWWALTGTWAGVPAWPQWGKELTPTIRCRIEGPHPSEFFAGTFKLRDGHWTEPQGEPVRHDPIIYARVDGGFSVWDPIRNEWRGRSDLLFQPSYMLPRDGSRRPRAYHFTPDALWNGLTQDGKVLCNGLIDDWIRWQYQPQKNGTSPFRMLSDVLAGLSPHPTREPIRPGDPVRISPDEARDIPTIELPYETIPVVFASAGMKRILGLAYLLVWTWYEHLQAARLLGQAPASHLTLLIDEIEAHLHPQWQRVILPSLLRVVAALQAELKVQIITTTHAPLVLASVEPLFDEEQDRLFVFEAQGGEVRLNEVPWAKQGDAVDWLTSESFGLHQARSLEAEQAIEAAEAFMRGDHQALPEHLQTRDAIHQELRRVLAGDDTFWPRWIVSAGAQQP
jgi:hypothetical protein